MDSELLRRGCERAGMRVELTGPEWFHRRWRVTHEEWTWSLDDPALPSYVADILVGMVREREDFGRDYQQRLYEVADPESYLATATSGQRITAALAVLEAGDGR